MWRSLRATGRVQACMCVLVNFISFLKKGLHANPILDTVPRTSQLSTLAHQLFPEVLVGTRLKEHFDVIVSCIPVSKNSTGPILLWLSKDNVYPFLFWARVGARSYCYLGTIKVVHMHPGSCGEPMNNSLVQAQTHYTSGFVWNFNY